MNQGKRMLRGLKVFDMMQFLTRSYCGLILADMGAEGIKVENSSGGDFVRTAVPQIVD